MSTTFKLSPPQKKALRLYLTLKNRFDEWNEEDHPRAENGQFGEGGGGGAKVAAAKEVLGKLGVKPSESSAAPHPAMAKAEEKYAAATKEHEAAKEKLAAAWASGNAEEIAKAQKENDKAIKKKAAVKFVLKKLAGPEAAAQLGKSPAAPKPAPKPTAPKPPPPPPPPPKPSSHLASGSTVKVAGKTSGGVPLVGTVLGQNQTGSHTLVLQLGASKPEWHANESLSSHTTNSTWAKEKEAAGKAKAATLGTIGTPFETLFPPQHAEAPAKAEKPASVKKVLQAAAILSQPLSPSHKPPEMQKGGSPPVTKASEWGAHHYGDWPKTLTATENNAVKNYSGSGYSSINQHLRGIQTHGSEVKGRIAAIDSALNKAPPLPHDVTLHRGMNGNFDIKEGDTYVDKGFMSTSIKKGFAGTTSLVIKAPAGSKGAYLVQSHHEHEHEVLLPRGSRIKITKIEHITQTGLSKRIVHGELLPHEKTDAEESKEQQEEKHEEPPEDNSLAGNPKFTTEEGDLILVDE